MLLLSIAIAYGSLRYSASLNCYGMVVAQDAQSPIDNDLVPPPNSVHIVHCGNFPGTQAIYPHVRCSICLFGKRFRNEQYVMHALNAICHRMKNVCYTMHTINNKTSIDCLTSGHIHKKVSKRNS